VIDKKKSVVISLVNNPCIHDARVLKEAAALSEAGHNVTIYARSGADVSPQESRDGFEIIRFDCYSLFVDRQDKLFAETMSIFGECKSWVQIAFTAAKANAAKMHKEKAKRDAKARVERMKAAREARVAARVSSVRTTHQMLNEAGTRAYALLVERLMGMLWGLKARLMLRTRAKRAIGNAILISRNLIQWAARSQKNVSPERMANTVSHTPYTRKMLRHRIRPVDDGMFYLRYFLYAYHIAALNLESKPDVIHAHDLYTLPAAILLARRTGAKVIFDAHEIETERIPPLPAEKKDFIDRLERTLFRETDAIVVCCESSADFYGERLRKERPVVVMNAPVLSATQESDAGTLEVINRLRSEAGAEIIIYTGGVGREARGLHIAVAALSYLPNAHMVILGPRHPANDEWLLGEAMSVGVSDRLHLIPPVSHSEVVDSIKKADVGICLIQDASLSYRYAMPNKLFEMAFAGLPLCVSDLPEMGRFVRELGAGVTVDQTNPRAIAEAIRHLMDHRDQYVLGESGKGILMDRYSWPAQKNVLRDLYGRLLSHD